MKKKKPGPVTKVIVLLEMVLFIGLFIAGIHVHLFSPLGIAMGVMSVSSAIIALMISFEYIKKRKLQICYRIIRSVPVVIVVVLVARVLIPSDDDWQRYTFQNELEAIEAKYQVPNEENAATQYDLIFSVLSAKPKPPDFINCGEPSAASQPWNPYKHPEIANWISGHSPLIEDLQNAAMFEKCSFPITQNYFADSSDRYDQFRYCSDILLASANGDVVVGDSDTALQKYFTVLKIGDHCLQQPETMDFLVGLGIQARALAQVNRLIVESEPTDEQLDLLEDIVILNDNWADIWPGILSTEKLQFKNFLASFYEINPKGEVRFTRNISEIFEIEHDTSFKKTMANKMAPIMLSGFLPLSPDYASDVIDDICEPIEKPNYSDDDINEFERLRGTEISRLYGLGYLDFIIGIDTDSVLRNRYRYSRLLSHRKATHILIALRRHKDKISQWPETLDKLSIPANLLVDPVNKDAFVYRLTEESFTLYSKGKNNIDEIGDSDRKKNDCTVPDDILFWPPKSRIKKEEAGD